jgi:PhnB protein
MAKRKKPAKKAAARPKAAAKKAAKKVAPVPPGYHSITPYIVCRNAAGAIEFYKKALGARVKAKMAGPDGKIMHAEIVIGDSVVMLGDEMPAMGATAPETIGGTASGLFIYTPNVDKAFARAIAAGAKAEMPPADQFWGDRYGTFVDPFGHKWSMATHIEDMTPKEMARRGREWMAQMASGGAPAS